jgi:hypothetical protein
VSENTHVKDWYVARVVELTNENKRLTKELEVYKHKIDNMAYNPALYFAAGVFVYQIITEAFK